MATNIYVVGRMDSHGDGDSCPRLELTLIPRFELRRDGASVRMGPCGQRLIAFLALHPGQVRREGVCAALWPNADTAHAAGGLRTLLWRIRAQDVVIASRTHLRLNNDVTIDVDVLNALARSLFGDRLPDQQLLRAADALASAQEGLLVDCADDWVVEERECFRQVWLHAMDQVGEWLLESGRSTRALHAALMVRRADPLRESASRLLVRVHAAQGNVAEAVREYDRYAGLLQAELGVAPSPALRDLVASLLPTTSLRES